MEILICVLLILVASGVLGLIWAFDELYMAVSAIKNLIDTDSRFISDKKKVEGIRQILGLNKTAQSAEEK